MIDFIASVYDFIRQVRTDRRRRRQQEDIERDALRNIALEYFVKSWSSGNTIPYERFAEHLHAGSKLGFIAIEMILSEAKAVSTSFSTLINEASSLGAVGEQSREDMRIASLDKQFQDPAISWVNSANRQRIFEFASLADDANRHS